MAEEHNSINQLWDYIKGHDSEISDVRTVVAGLAAEQQATNSKLDMVVNSMIRMEGVLNRPQQSPNYAGLATVFIGASALIGSLFVTSISPIREDVHTLQAWKESHQADLLTEAYDNGRRDQAIDDLRKRRFE